MSAPIPSDDSTFRPIGQVLARLDDAHRSRGGWMACCPHHHDRTASLSIKEANDGRVLLRCHAGCAAKDVVAALGLQWRDLFPATIDASPNGLGRQHREAGRRDYQLPDGTIHRRIDYSDGTKSFVWSRPDGRLGLDGRSPVALPLYGVEDLDALPDGAEVVVAEGEKTSDALRYVGCAAVGTVTGASCTPSDDSLRPLVRLAVLLWADNDEGGRRHMAGIAAALLRLGARDVRCVSWPEAPSKGDAADFVNLYRGGADIDKAEARAELEVLLAAAKAWEAGESVLGASPMLTDEEAGPRVFTIADARLRRKEAIEHLPVLGVDGYIVKGWTHLLAGWWRLGKTELMAAVVLPWLRSGMLVVWVTEEPDTIWADRADTCDEIYAAVPWGNITLVDAMSAAPEALLDTVESVECDVVIIDTIREVCGIGSMKNDDEIRNGVSPWVRRLRDGQRTLIFLAQHRKAAGEHGERVEGSVALPSMMDIVLELEAVDGRDRQRRLTVRRRRSQTAPLIYEMDDDDRMRVVPDPRSRSRIETEAAVLFTVTANNEPLTTVEVCRKLTPKASRDTVRRALTAHAEAGRILRRPPITEDAAGRTVTWESASAAQPEPTQNSIPLCGEFSEQVGVAQVGDVSDAPTTADHDRDASAVEAFDL